MDNKLTANAAGRAVLPIDSEQAQLCQVFIDAERK